MPNCNQSIQCVLSVPLCSSEVVNILNSAVTALTEIERVESTQFISSLANLESPAVSSATVDLTQPSFLLAAACEWCNYNQQLTNHA